jgi:hypothetical protein
MFEDGVDEVVKLADGMPSHLRSGVAGSLVLTICPDSGVNGISGE